MRLSMRMRTAVVMAIKIKEGRMAALIPAKIIPLILSIFEDLSRVG
jgi:hypothetical protein